MDRGRFRQQLCYGQVGGELRPSFFYFTDFFLQQVRVGGRNKNEIH